MLLALASAQYSYTTVYEQEKFNDTICAPSGANTTAVYSMVNIDEGQPMFTPAELASMMTAGFMNETELMDFMDSLFTVCQMKCASEAA